MPAEVRDAGPADAAAVAAVYAPYVEGTAVSFEQVAPDAAEVARRMAVHPLPWLVAERDGVVTGWACASPHRARAAYRWSVDVSAYLVPAEQGRGTGRALYTRLLAVLADLGYATAHAGIALPNPASVGLHEAMGFRPVGTYEAVGFKHGRWVDVGWWRRPLAALPEVPAEPLDWVSSVTR